MDGSYYLPYESALFLFFVSNSVPPLHRQVLIVLTQFKSNLKYKTNCTMKCRVSSDRFLDKWPKIKGQNVTNLPSITHSKWALHVARPWMGLYRVASLKTLLPN